MLEFENLTIPERPKRKESLVGEELDGMDEIIYVDIDSGSTISLNSLASAIFELCDGSRTVEEMATIIVETLKSDPERTLKDTRAIIQEFAAYQLFTE